MTNCPYCKQEVNKEFSQRTPEGNCFCFPCSDLALDEWVKLKEENERLKAVDEAAKDYVKIMESREFDCLKHTGARIAIKQALSALNEGK